VALLDKHADAAEVLLVGTSFAADFPVLRKEIRALDPHGAAGYLRAGSARVRVVERDDLPAAVTAGVLVVPDEELMRTLVERFGLAEGRELLWERTFLRWDRDWSLAGRPGRVRRYRRRRRPGPHARHPGAGRGGPEFGLVASGRRAGGPGR